MMPLYTLLILLAILASPMKIAQSKGIHTGEIEHSDTNPVEISLSEVTTNYEVKRTLDKSSLKEHRSDLATNVESVSDKDTGKGDSDDVKVKVGLDGKSAMEKENADQVNQIRSSEIGGEETSLDEELQQDLPDIWSDTGQLLSAILDNPIRLEEAPSSSLGVDSPSEEDAVECPAPVVLVTPALCGAPACLTHRHCRDPETACCFNGCVHTCLRPLDAPAVIDWLEDTSLIQPMLDEAPGIPKYPMLFEGTSSIAYAQGGGEGVHLQGGCTITSEQYDQLKDYMTKTNIQDCSCTGGEVVCVVKPYKREDE